MLHKLCPRRNDPNLLNLNKHIISAPLASDCFAPFDDVEIATGQAGFDDGDVHPTTGSCINSHHSYGLGEDLNDVLDDFDFWYIYRKHLHSEDLRLFADVSIQPNPSSQRTSKGMGHWEV